MKLIYKLFRLNPEAREDIIAATSGLGIFTNIVLASIKVIIGLMASSIAIVSEGVNNFADVLSAFLTFVGTKLAGKHPDEKHPFGYGRIEYLVSLVISVLILVSGIEMLKSAIDLIINPAPLKISYLALGIVLVSAVIKFILGVYTVKMGEKADSRALVGVGVDSKNDSYASVITITSSLLFLLFGISVDAYAGVIIAFLIMKAGFELLKDTIGDILGRPGEYDLAVELYRIIRGTDGVISAADMMLHNYGPDAWSGSVNVELDHKKTVGEIYKVLHDLQLRIMHEYNVTMVFGVYAVDNDNEQARELRARIADFVKAHEHIKSYHAVYVSEKESRIYCDFIVEYALRDWDGLREEFKAYIGELYPGYDLELTLETDFV
ncbi:MAG: cation transporter [Clostridiales bacterium]|nr:cation transporter [Candidatus Crickella merdequi]